MLIRIDGPEVGVKANRTIEATFDFGPVFREFDKFMKLCSDSACDKTLIAQIEKFVREQIIGELKELLEKWINCEPSPDQPAETQPSPIVVKEIFQELTEQVQKANCGGN